jgi:hypothetical protein
MPTTIHMSCNKLDDLAIYELATVRYYDAVSLVVANYNTSAVHLNFALGKPPLPTRAVRLDRTVRHRQYHFMATCAVVGQGYHSDGRVDGMDTTIQYHLCMAVNGTGWHWMTSPLKLYRPFSPFGRSTPNLIMPVMVALQSRN